MNPPFLSCSPGWSGTTSHWYHRPEGDVAVPQDHEVANAVYHSCPAYDLGYLLRKLPGDLKMSRLSNGDWLFRSSGSASLRFTPEDGACKLAIELFKQGVLQELKEEAV